MPHTCTEETARGVQLPGCWRAMRCGAHQYSGARYTVASCELHSDLLVIYTRNRRCSRSCAVALGHIAYVSGSVCVLLVMQQLYCGALPTFVDILICKAEQNPCIAGTACFHCAE
jgi:hypothetical protein